ncbi:MAG TPA: DUF2207 domain-containing protein [Acidimicrobiales bacterium]|nr:DUF2207 domain-containing protein [Acidimicrobiales bacterium]
MFVAATPAQAKSFSIAAINVEAVLNPDASMDVVEHITYDFDGHFSHGTRPIPPGDYRIVEMRVLEGGRSLPTSGAPNDLTWDFSADSERRTFDVAYRVVGAAKVGADVGELYWKWLGTEHPGVRAFSAVLRYPGLPAGVRAWGHGPLSGEVSLAPGVVRWDLPNGVPERTFVEGRVAVPAASFSIPPSGGPRLPKILSQEGKDAADANAVRARFASADRDRDRRIDRINTWFPLVPVLGWVVFLLVWMQWGKEPDRPTDIGEYVREPPDDPPALVDPLLRFGTISPLALSATIVDLAQRGALTITEERKDRILLPDKVDWRFTQRETPPDLRPFEREVLERLFADGSEITQAEFVAWGKDHPRSARAWWTGFIEKIDDELRDRDYLSGGRLGPFSLNLVAAMCVGAAGISAVGSGAFMGTLGIVSALAQGAATVVLRQRTGRGARRAAEWRAFKHFLKDFSQLGDAPVGHLVLWERYLVYSVALGVSDEVSKGLAMRLPAEQSQQFGAWYVGSSSVGGFGSLGRFGEDFGSTVQSAFVPSQSSSSGGGGGGGFSGGGGGGGGGGGVGAS